MTTPRHESPARPSSPEPPGRPRDRLLLAFAGAAATWVLAWLLVPLQDAAGWALPVLLGGR